MPNPTPYIIHVRIGILCTRCDPLQLTELLEVVPQYSVARKGSDFNVGNINFQLKPYAQFDTIRRT